LKKIARADKEHGDDKIHEVWDPRTASHEYKVNFGKEYNKLKYDSEFVHDEKLIDFSLWKKSNDSSKLKNTPPQAPEPSRRRTPPTIDNRRATVTSNRPITNAVPRTNAGGLKKAMSFFSRCWNKIEPYKWYVGATLGAVSIPLLFRMLGVDYRQLPGLSYFQSSEEGTKSGNKRTPPRNNGDPPASSGLTKPQWAGIAAAAAFVGYGGYSKLCSSKTTEVDPEERSGILAFSESDQSGTKKSFWQNYGLMIGLLIIFLIGLGLVLTLVLGGDSQNDDNHQDDLEWGSGDNH